MGCYHYDAARSRLTLAVYVQPNARTSEVAGLHGDALKLRIAAPALDNRANAELIDFLHQWFKLPSSRITIKQGARGRHKLVVLDTAGAEIKSRIALLENACRTSSHSA